MIPNSVVEQVQISSDIVDVISSYIQLKRSGRNFKALCPFHNEKTPSFFVNPEKQIWHCFGCGAGGTVFNFIMQYDRINFPEAVRLLAAKASIEVPNRYSKAERDGEKKADLYQLNDHACSWFQRQLKTTAAGKKVLTYLHKRGLNDEFIEEFSLGYAPDSWDALLKAAKKKGYTESALLSLGLVMQKEEKSRTFDRFRNRLMIPIRDVSGRVVGFSGRVMDDGSPKYMNSPESILFNKGRILYGLYHTKRAIVDAGFAILVEGHFDFFSLYKAGIKNVVAVQGTAITAGGTGESTESQAKILKRYVENVVICLDSDVAGQSAARLHGLDAMLQTVLEARHYKEGLSVKILVLPPKHDPDSFVREKGGEAFKKLVENAPVYFDFLMDLLCQKHDVGTEVGKGQIASEFLSALARVPSPILRESYCGKLSGRLGVSQEALLAEMKRVARRQPIAARREDDAPQPEVQLPAGEKEILKHMLDDEKLIGLVAAELKPEDFRDQQLQYIAKLVFSMHKKKEWGGASRLLTRLPDERYARIVCRLVSEEAPSGDREKVARDCIRHIRLRNKRERIKKLTEEIGRMEKGGSPDKEIIARQKLLMQEKLS